MLFLLLNFYVLATICSSLVDATIHFVVICFSLVNVVTLPVCFLFLFHQRYYSFRCSLFNALDVVALLATPCLMQLFLLLAQVLFYYIVMLLFLLLLVFYSTVLLLFLFLSIGTSPL